MKQTFIFFLFMVSLMPAPATASQLSVQLIESQMQRENPMTKWQYYYGFYMYSQLKIYQRTQEPDTLRFVEQWADVTTKDNGRSYKKLDNMFPGLALLYLYEETGNEQYLNVAKNIREAFKTYPRTSNGGFYHMANRKGQLWLDGLYMANVFLAKYGQLVGEREACFDEAIRQICAYAGVLKDAETGLFYHAYDETGASDWADKESKHSREFWGRSMGWTIMAMVEVLDIIPEGYPQRHKVKAILNDLVMALVAFQDPETGLWYQVINRADDPDNWLETSCSAMYSYSIAKAVHKGWIDKSYLQNAIQAYRGVIHHKVDIDKNGLYNVKDICHGTGVSDYNYYLSRPPTVNNLRGLPAVILMCEELRDHAVTVRKLSAEEAAQRKQQTRNALNSRYNVLDYGVNPDGKTLNTHAVQRVIELCTKSGGGTVYFPTGDYLTGTLILKNNVYLELSPGATIYGSKDIDDYIDGGGDSLLYAKGARNIGIIGQGTLNGNGDSFWRDKERPYVRPDRFLLFEECRNIRVNGITMLNSPNWNLDLVNCDYAWIDGVSMISDLDSPNTDGIDPTSSSHVFISNCYFELGDDCICPKSRGTKATEYLVVENCIMKSDDSAIKLGTRSEVPIRHAVFNNIIIKDTQYGIAFFAKDGGTFEDIRFSNIIIESARNEEAKSDRPSGSYPIFLDIERRKPDGPLSAIRDIHFSDITINSKDGHCLFLGQPDRKIENLYFENIQFNLETHRTLEGSKKPRGVRSLKDRAANDYSHIPANFAFAYINNLHIDGLKIRDNDKTGQYERHMIWGYDVHGVQLSGLRNTLAAPNRELAQLAFKDATAIAISACQPTYTTSAFISLAGAETKNVCLLNNNFSNLVTVVEAGDDFELTELTEFNNLRR